VSLNVDDDDSVNAKENCKLEILIVIWFQKERQDLTEFEEHLNESIMEKI